MRRRAELGAWRARFSVRHAMVSMRRAMVSMRRAMVSMRHAMVSMRRAGFAAWDAARKRRRIVDLRGAPPFTAGTPNKKGAPLARDAFASTAGFVFQTAASSADRVFFLAVLANRCLRAICCSGIRVRAVFRRASRYWMRAQGRGRIVHQNLRFCGCESVSSASVGHKRLRNKT